MLNQFAQKLDAPIIFAADTNLTREMQSYPLLTKKVFLNIFDLPLKPFIKNPTANPRDLCYLRKGKVFPECQVDHILLSKRDQWSVKHLEIDLLKTSDKKFPSDHRPIITTIKLLSKN